MRVDIWCSKYDEALADANKCIELKPDFAKVRCPDSTSHDTGIVRRLTAAKVPHSMGWESYKRRRGLTRRALRWCPGIQARRLTRSGF